MTADELRNAIDNDKAFQSKRKALIFVSLLLLALVVSGAQVKEANTFIFKIEFANHAGLQYLLFLSVLVCAVRYYSYSERYNNQLFKIWSGRLLGDYRVYRVDREVGEIDGLLGKRLHVYGGDYDIDNPVYRKSGFMRRSIGLDTSTEHEGEEYYYTDYFDLCAYGSHWTNKDFRKLLVWEAKYRLQAWVKYRETLDLASPYLLAAVSVISFLAVTVYKFLSLD
ncbi:hypothetical protein [Pseudomonas putida]|uniref:hypothetical protein n=1 Tax=Pseudomonas putida TaxID=303 RepID=UPI00216A150A|nr:hypothetical protein [Pseudomonas putida]MCS4064768.1 hypothetical protein [Pseudomonas putida]